MKLEFSQQIFGKKYYNIKFHENPSTETPDERRDGGADSHTKLTVAFRNFGNTPKNELTPRFGRQNPPPTPTPTVLRQQ